MNAETSILVSSVPHVWVLYLIHSSSLLACHEFFRDFAHTISEHISHDETPLPPSSGEWCLVVLQTVVEGGSPTYIHHLKAVPYYQLLATNRYEVPMCSN